MNTRYSIKERIGQGGLGAVYKAFDNNLGREVALKRVLPAGNEDPHEMAKNLLKEAKTLSALQHPHVVTVYDVGEDSEGPFVVMELLKGETLDATIKRGALPSEDFQQVVIQSLEALVAAQTLGITHRDLKPANIMVIWLPSGKFQIKILDFGLAKFSQQPSVQTIDHADSILGSIYFMAPEQFERLPLDSRTDLYSIGAIYYFTLTGQYPFQGDNAPQVMAAHLQHRFKPLATLRPDLPAYIPQWVEWLMSREAKKRPVDASEALKFFHQKKAGGTPAAIPVAIPAAIQAKPTTSGKLVASKPAAVGAQSGRLVASQPGQVGNRTGKLVAQSASPAKTATATAQALPANQPPASSAGEKSAVLTPVPSGPGFFARIPKWALVTAPTLLIAVASYAVYQYLEAARITERNGKFEEIVNRGEAPGTPEDIKLLAFFLEDMEDDRSAIAASAMSRLQGDDIDDALLKLLPKYQGKPLVNLITAIGERRSPDSFDSVLPYAKAKNTEVRKAALNTLGVVGSNSNISELIGVLESASEPADREFVENAILNIARTNPDLDDRTNPIISAMGGAEKDTKLSLLNILGTLGGEDAFNTISKYLTDPETDFRLGAVKTLETWPNGAPLKSLIELCKTEQDTAVKIVAYRSASQLSQLPGPLSEAEVQKLLEEALGATTHKRSQETLRNAIASLADDSAITYLKSLESDPTLKNFVKDAIDNVNKLKKEIVALGNGGSIPPAKAALLPAESIIQDGILKEWAYVENRIVWRFSIAQGGTFRIEVEQSSESEDSGSYSVHIGDKILLKDVQNTGGEFKSVHVGEVELKSPGIYKVWIQPVSVDSEDRLMDLKDFKLIPK